MILTVSSFAFCFVKKRLAHNQSRPVPKTSLNVILHGFSGIGNHMSTVKTLYNVTRYNRIFNIQHKIAGNGSVSIKIPSL